jgi:low temperature requirement protein LtrA
MAGPTLATFDRLRGRGIVRDVDEEHRTATPLELFFDLIFVVAISRAAAALRHELAAGDVADGVLGFVGVFFAVWWAWMNFTWFASAHDSGDVPYRILTLVQMAGALVLAVGVTDALEHGDWLVVTVGYAIMRVGLATNWLRVARDQPAVRFRCRRYAAGVVGMQLLWFARLALPDALGVAVFPLLVLGELAVPMWAERAAPRPIFHAEHIEERYGLFTIIVLGESVLSAATGFQTALDEAGLTASLFSVGVGGLLLAFTAWWLYFEHPGHLAPDPSVSFRWGYGHVAIFAALAAMGAGLHVATEAVTGHAGDRVAALAVAVPVAGYLAGLALVMALTGTPVRSRQISSKVAGGAAVVLLGLLTSPAVTVAGGAVVMLVLTASMVVSTPPPATPPPAPGPDGGHSTHGAG